MSEPSKTVTFATEAERDAFMKGILWEREEYPADIVRHPPLNGKYEVELFRIHDAEESMVA